MDAMPTSDPLHDPSPVRSFGFRLWQVKHAFTRRLAAAMEPLGLTHMQYILLRTADHLAQGGEQPTQARLAEWTGTDRMMVSKVLRLLESKGLITRPVHPGDPRAHHVVLTEAGQRILRDAVPVALRTQQQFFGRLGHARARQFGAMLDELMQLDGRPLDADVTATTKDAS